MTMEQENVGPSQVPPTAALVAALIPAPKAVDNSPSCREHLGTVWAFCGKIPFQKWGIGPEGADKARGNCHYSYTKGGNKDACKHTFVMHPAGYDATDSQSRSSEDIPCDSENRIFLGTTQTLNECKAECRDGCWGIFGRMDPVNPDQAGTACWTCPPGIPPPNNNANSYAYWVKQVQPTATPTAAPTPAPTAIACCSSYQVLFNDDSTSSISGTYVLDSSGCGASSVLADCWVHSANTGNQYRDYIIRREHSAWVLETLYGSGYSSEPDPNESPCPLQAMTQGYHTTITCSNEQA